MPLRFALFKALFGELKLLQKRFLEKLPSLLQLGASWKSSQRLFGVLAFGLSASMAVATPAVGADVERW